MSAITERQDAWLERLRLPAYRVVDAAKYAGVTPTTVHNWQKTQGRLVAPLSDRESRDALSYLQLVELRVVAAMRAAGVKLKKIRLAREYLAKEWNADHPFALEYLMTDGQYVLLDLEKIEGVGMADKVLVADKGGQYSWKPIVGNRFQEFDYEREMALRWRVGGKRSPVVIDPRIAFGAPSVKGVPTWVLIGREKAGESPEEIAEDFFLTVPQVNAALLFERGTAEKNKKSSRWLN